VSQFSTEQGAMQAGATAVDTAQQAIQGHITTLRSEVEQMMSGWRGEASGAFTNVHTAFETNAGRILTALGQMHTALVATHQTYGAQETGQAQTFTGMHNTINEA